MNERQHISLRLLVFVLTASAIPQAILAQTHLRRNPDSVVEFNNSIFPSRDAQKHSPSFQPDATGTNPEYLVHGADILSVQCLRAGTDIPVALTLRADPPLDHPECVQGDLVRNSPELRIPCALLIEREAEGLKVSAPGCTADLVLYDARPGQERWIVDYKEIVWSKLLRLLKASLTSQFKKHDYDLSVKLVHRERVFVIPGDTFVLRRVSRIPRVNNDEENRPHVTRTFELKVDETGSVHVPPVTVPSVLELDPETASPLERKVVASIERSTHLVRVHHPDHRRSDRCSLDDLASCLTAAPALGDPLPELLKEKCRLLGIHQQFRPQKKTEKLLDLRYFTEPLNRSWSLVLPGGKVHEVSYTQPSTLSTAVISAYRRITGKSIWNYSRNLRIVVMTEDGRGDPSEPPTFWGKLSKDETSVFDSALLLPGDRILLSQLDKDSR